MSYACAPILVGVASPVSEILILSKTAKFPFRTMDYSPWSSKNLINRNWPKKILQVRVDELCMCTNFGGHGSSGFGDIDTLKTAKFPFRTMDYSPWSSKNLINRNWPKKILQVRVDELCMCTNFGGHGSSGFGDIDTLKTAKFPFRTMDYSPWSSKNLINRNWPKKILQVRVDELCMCTNFGGHGSSGFGDIDTLKTAKFPFRTMDYSPWSSKN